MPRLNQIVAVEKGEKAKATRRFTELHRLSQLLGPLSGIVRTYQPRQEDGDHLPDERTRVQYSVEELNDQVVETLGNLFNIVATKDFANRAARADLVVDGETLLLGVPVPYLLWLEKQLADLRTYVDKLPTLDPAEVWSHDSATGVYRSAPVQTVKTRKVPKNHVRAEATDKHPAQVDVFTVDEPVGDWTTTKFSGAITEDRRLALLERVDKLANAVKFAREQANSMEVDEVDASGLVRYIFED